MLGLKSGPDWSNKFDWRAIPVKRQNVTRGKISCSTPMMNRYMKYAWRVRDAINGPGTELERAQACLDIATHFDHKVKSSTKYGTKKDAGCEEWMEIWASITVSLHLLCQCPDLLEPVNFASIFSEIEQTVKECLGELPRRAHERWIEGVKLHCEDILDNCENHVEAQEGLVWLLEVKGKRFKAEYRELYYSYMARYIEDNVLGTTKDSPHEIPT